MHTRTTRPGASRRARGKHPRRGRVLARFGEQVVAANWDSLVVDVGRGALVRIPMMEPLRGTRELVGELVDGATSVRDLLDGLADDDQGRIKRSGRG